MRISTRTRYGLRLMIYLALNYDNGYAFLKDIAKSEGISEKYLSLIVIPLKAAGMLATIRGVHGGYILSKHPSKISVKEIVEILEGDLSLVECSKDEKYCIKSKNCVTHDIWSGLSEKIADFLDSFNLEEIAKIQGKKSIEITDYAI
ncbi:MAG: RrF2 family transcriptional regulator [Candidatus Humimicrobiaceae bacterium]